MRGFEILEMLSIDIDMNLLHWHIALAHCIQIKADKPDNTSKNSNDIENIKSI